VLVILAGLWVQSAVLSFFEDPLARQHVLVILAGLGAANGIGLAGAWGRSFDDEGEATRAGYPGRALGAASGVRPLPAPSL
jgi:hypothetical protein